MTALSYRRLDSCDASHVRDLQRLLEAAPSYAWIIEGKPPAANAAEELLTETPPGKMADDKLVLGIFDESGLVGCLDLIRGYPSPETAYIGLLLFRESHQGKGLGVEALAHADALAASWNCSLLRLGVIATNLQALSFWSREGFREVCRKPMPRFMADAIVMERHVRTARTETEGMKPL